MWQFNRVFSNLLYLILLLKHYWIQDPNSRRGESVVKKPFHFISLFKLFETIINCMCFILHQRWDQHSPAEPVISSPPWQDAGSRARWSMRIGLSHQAGPQQGGGWGKVSCHFPFTQPSKVEVMWSWEWARLPWQERPIVIAAAHGIRCVIQMSTFLTNLRGI